MMLACERAADHIGKLWGPMSLECKWLAVIERYRFICCSLMTHEIKKYLLRRGCARCVCVCVCLEAGFHGDKQSILVTNCGGGRLEWVCVRSVYMHATVCIIYVWDLCMIFLSVCVCVCDIRMYRRTSNMAGLTYPPTALTALKVKTKTVLLPQSH